MGVSFNRKMFDLGHLAIPSQSLRKEDILKLKGRTFNKDLLSRHVRGFRGKMDAPEGKPAHVKGPPQATSLKLDADLVARQDLTPFQIVRPNGDDDGVPKNGRLILTNDSLRYSNDRCCVVPLSVIGLTKNCWHGAG